MEFILYSVDCNRENDDVMTEYGDSLKNAGFKLTKTRFINWSDCPIYTIELNSLDDLLKLRETVYYRLLIEPLENSGIGIIQEGEKSSLPRNVIIIGDNYLS